MVFKEFLRRHVAPMVLAGTMSGTILSGLPLIVNAEEVSSIVVESEDKVKLSDYYKTKEEAEEWLYNEIEVLLATNEITNVELYLYKGIVDNTETIFLDEAYSNKEDALKRVEELKYNGFYHDNVEITESSYIKSNIKKVFVNKAFTSIEELEKYKNSLENEANLNVNITEFKTSWICMEEGNLCNIVSESEKELEKNIFEYIKEEKKNENINFQYEFDVDKCYDKESGRFVAILHRKTLIRDDVYNLTASYDRITKEKITIYNLKGEMSKPILEDRYRVEITYRQIDKENELEENNEYLDNPNTGDENNIDFYSMGMISSSIGLTALCSKVKKKIKR